MTTILMTGGLVGLDALPAAADASITSAGPLTQVGVGSNLNCSANHTGDTSGEFFNNTSCGTWTIVDGVLYGPALQATAFTTTPYTAVSQTAVTGTGTNVNPFKVVTVVDAGSTGVRLTQTDTYTTGLESFRTDVAVSNTSGASHAIRVYRAADCFLQNSDSGFGSLDTGTGAVACTTSLAAGARIEQWFPITAGSHAYEDRYSTVYSKIAGNLAFDDTCTCSTQQDNGAGLSWDATLAASASKTFSSLITFSPLGVQPLSLSITPDNASVLSGGTAGYTITVHNPNAGSVTLASLSDVIPATFTYVAGSTTGLTTANPTIGGGNTLTWAGPLAVASGDHTLHFSANVGSTAGTFTSSATATNGDGFTIAPSGPDGAVTVSGTPPPTHHLTVTTAGSGSGSVASSPSGITCPSTCGADFTSGATVGLMATPASGSTFSGWSGACTGSGGCTVTMSADRSVTATFTTTTPGGLTITATTTPQTISPGGTAKTRFRLSNGGESTAHGVALTVTLPTGATPISITPSTGGCSGFTNRRAVCLFGDIAAGGTRGVDVLFTAPAGTTGSVVVQADATSGDAGTAHGTGGPTAVAPRVGSARGFVPPGGSISTGNDPTSANPIVATFELPNTGSGAPITLRLESCNDPNHPCTGGKVLFLSPFTGYNDPNRPPELKIVWDKSIVNTSTSFPIYIQKVENGPYVTIPNCKEYGDEDDRDVADPHPCVELRKRRSNDDIEAHILLLSGDPRLHR